MTSGREITPPPGFSVVPITTTMFAATTPENTPLAYRASTSTNPNPAASPRDRKRRERVVGFEETQNRGESRVERNSEGGRPSEEASRGNGGQNANLPPLLAAHMGRSDNGQPLQSSLTSAYGGQALPKNIGGNLPPNAHGLPFANSDRKPLTEGSFANLPQGGHVPSTITNGNILPQNSFMHPANIPPNSYPFYAQLMCAFPNMPTYVNPNPTGLFPNPLGSVTPFVHWRENYPLLDELKMPSHIGSYDGKGDPDNFLHLFEGAIRMQKWLMSVACHTSTYTLKDSARIWWNSQKAGSILDYEDLKAKFRSHFSQQKKFTKTYPAVHNIKQRENEITRAFITRYTDDTLQILGIHEDQRISGFIHGLRTRSLVEHLSIDLPLTYKGLMEKTYTWVEAREVATNGISSDRMDSFDRPKKSSLNHNKGQMDGRRSFPYKGESHKLLSNLAKSPREILATERIADRRKDPRAITGWEELRFPHPRRRLNGPRSNQGVHIGKSSKQGISGQRKLVRREESWPLGEIPLQVTIGEGPRTITKTLTFAIVRSDSPHNLLLGRTAMQEMGIVVSTVHGAIKFHTPNGVGTILSEHNSQRTMKEEGSLTNIEGHHRETIINKDKNAASRPPKSTCRCFRMDYSSHNRSTENINYRRRNLQHRTSTECVQSHRTGKTKEEEPGP
ncbi:reverse transcriptase domain-containing protein [Tanacetum coccineum]